MTENIALDLLDAHPQNPRKEMRTEVVDALVAQIATVGFDEAHAILVRPIDGRYQIVSGHHRVAAARKVGLATVPAWVREMSDEEAFMALVLTNTQSELSPLERGAHALEATEKGKWGKSVSAYAEKVGRPSRSVQNEVWAARVAKFAPGGKLPEFRTLTEIHSAPEWLWAAIVELAANEEWTKEKTTQRVRTLQDVPDKLGIAWNLDALAKAVVAGSATAAAIRNAEAAAEKIVQACQAEVTGAGLPFDIGEWDVRAKAATKDAVSPAAVIKSLNEIHQSARSMADAERRRQAEADAAREEAASRIVRLRSFCTIEEWKALDADARSELLATEGSTGFNKTNDSVEWAWWTWNPITGCNHGCPYCYARVIAHSARMASVYPNGFAPTLCASRLKAPRNTKVPKEAQQDGRYRNVFMNSMSDLFGRWVPSEWIEAVLAECRAAPEWNFLCLTKFPKRMAEFDIPENVWMGASVDYQVRVKATEAGFAKVRSKVKWLSIEPMLERLTFDRLDLFDLVVIGGSSSQPATPDSPATPAWTPPYEWIHHLVDQARSAGCKVYQKTNLFAQNPRLLELPFDAPIPQDATEPPEVFRYLGKGASASEAA